VVVSSNSKKDEGLERQKLVVKVIIPVYRSSISSLEELSLLSIRRHIPAQILSFIVPESLDISGVLRPGESVEFFPDNFFDGIEGYNRLMTSTGLYERFEQYSHLLICQLDCLIFSNELEYWAAQDYDYIAAPWFRRFEDNPTEGLWRVGNGGFSLRNIHSHLRVLKRLVIRGSIYPTHGKTPWEPTDATAELGSYEKLYPLYQKLNPLLDWITLEEELKSYPFNEDLFWSLEAPKHDSQFRVASAEVALPFAFEMSPSWCFENNNNKLPFGCHAWARYDRAFWEQYLF
jgi:hypothetical protein